MRIVARSPHSASFWYRHPCRISQSTFPYFPRDGRRYEVVREHRLGYRQQRLLRSLFAWRATQLLPRHRFPDPGDVHDRRQLAAARDLNHRCDRDRRDRDRRDRDRDRRDHDRCRLVVMRQLRRRSRYPSLGSLRWQSEAKEAKRTVGTQ